MLGHILFYSFFCSLLPLALSCSNPLGSNTFSQASFLSPPGPYCSGTALTNTPYAGGSGTSVDPYTICTAAQLNSIGASSANWAFNFKVMADLNLTVYTGTQFNIIGSLATPFSGTFDGNHHVISNLSYSSGTAYYVGLFGMNGASGTIQNVYLTQVSLLGYQYTGSIAGYNAGNISNCYSTGSVSSTNFAGGLSGSNHGTITQSYSQASVSGTYGIGGFVGTNYGPISYCYSTGAVFGALNYGGFDGSSLGLEVTNSYWDNQTSNQPSSDAGAGKATALMKTASTFVGWDPTIWLLQNGSYPTFK